jgi:hypothetical protein
MLRATKQILAHLRVKTRHGFCSQCPHEPKLRRSDVFFIGFLLGVAVGRVRWR